MPENKTGQAAAGGGFLVFVAAVAFITWWNYTPPPDTGSPIKPDPIKPDPIKPDPLDAGKFQLVIPSPVTELSFHPTFLPFKLSVNSNWEFGVSASSELVTPLGTVEVSESATFASWGNEDLDKKYQNTLVLGRDDAKMATLFKLQPGIDYKPMLDPGAAFQISKLDKTDNGNLKVTVTSAPPNMASILQSIQLASLPPTLDFKDPAPKVTDEDRKEIIHFLLEADEAERTAFLWNNPVALEPYYEGDAYQKERAALENAQTRGDFVSEVLDATRSYVSAIRFPDHSTIEVDACESWSHTIFHFDNGILKNQLVPPHDVLQTFTIKQTRMGWRIGTILYRQSFGVIPN